RFDHGARARPQLGSAQVGEEEVERRAVERLDDERGLPRLERLVPVAVRVAEVAEPQPDLGRARVLAQQRLQRVARLGELLLAALLRAGRDEEVGELAAQPALARDVEAALLRLADRRLGAVELALLEARFGDHDPRLGVVRLELGRALALALRVE